MLKLRPALFLVCLDNFEVHDQNILKFIVDTISIDLQSYRTLDFDLAFVREILSAYEGNEKFPTVFSALQDYKADYAELIADPARSEDDRRESEAEEIDTFVAIAG